MRWFDNLSIKMKMLTVSAVMLALVLGLSLFAVFQMGVISNTSNDIADNWFPSARQLNNMQLAIGDVYATELQYRNSISVDAHQKAMQEGLAEIRSVIQDNEKKYVPMIASQEEYALYEDYLKWRSQFLKLIFRDDGTPASPVSSELDLFVAYQQVRSVLEDLIKLNVDGAKLASQHADEVYVNSRRWLIGAVLTTLVLALLLIAIMHYRIAMPIRRFAKIANNIEQGELTVRSEIHYAQDELGELARSFDRMAETLQSRQQEVAQANNQLSQKFNQLQAIHRLAERINQLSTPQDVYAEAINTLQDAAHVDRSAVLLFDEQGIMRFVAARGLSDYYKSRAEGHNPWTGGESVAHSISVADIVLEPSLAGLHQALAAEGIRAVAFIPLLYQNRLLGKFMLYHNNPHEFSAEEIQLAETIASQVAFAIERERQTVQFRHQALYDNLTNIPNRSLLQDRLRQAIVTSQRTGTPLTLLLIDLDRFKDINDTLGHDQGDLLLKQIGPRIQSVLRQFDTVARLGGDEFAVVLPTVSTADHAELTAVKILRSLQAPFVVGTYSMEIGASIGIALYPEHGLESDTLLRCADVAMYVAKRQHSGCAMYSQQLDQHSLRKLTLISELRNAIEQNQLVLEYQPKISLKNQEFMGVEALVRWMHPHHGLIYPDQFVPEAEHSEQEKPLREWVISQALQQHSVWRGMGHAVPVAVNLSARSLHDVSLPRQLEKLLRKHQVSSDMLTLEITESAIMIDPQRALEVLTQISQMGIHLTIDDFGTGYSSLAYLQKLPVDAVKIDKSFVIEMHQDMNNSMIVRSTIELAHNLNILVTAEGVESQQTWLALAMLDCDVAQGFYISSPVSPDGFIDWLQKSQRQMELNATMLM